MSMPILARFRPFFSVVAVFLCAIPVFSANAAESPWRSADYLQARLSSPLDPAGTDAAIPALLELRLADGWHAYWRMPGDGGLPPRLDWSGSMNVASVDVGWPVPERFEMAGLYSFGYEGTVSFPLTVKLQSPGTAASLDLNADIMVCRDICMPQPMALSLDFPAGPAAAADSRMMERARARLPATADSDDLRIDSVVIGPDALVAHVTSRGGFDGADLFVESGDLYITAPPAVSVDPDDPHKAMFTVARPEGAGSLAEAVKGVTVTVTVTQGGKALEKSYPF